MSAIFVAQACLDHAVQYTPPKALSSALWVAEGCFVAVMSLTNVSAIPHCGCVEQQLQLDTPTGTEV